MKAGACVQVADNIGRRAGDSVCDAIRPPRSAPHRSWQATQDCVLLRKEAATPRGVQPATPTIQSCRKHGNHIRHHRTGRRTATTRSHSVALGSALAMLLPARPRAAQCPQPAAASLPAAARSPGRCTGQQRRPAPDQSWTSSTAATPASTLAHAQPRVPIRARSKPNTRCPGGQQMMMAVRNPGAGQTGGAQGDRAIDE